VTVSYTNLAANNIGKVRTYIQDTDIGYLVNRTIFSQSNNVIKFSAAFMVADLMVGYDIYPDSASAISYEIVANGTSTITILGDISTTVASSGTSAIVNKALFTDDEINNFLSQTGSDVLMAASLGLKSLAANKAKLAKKFKRTGVGGIEIEQREIKQILDLAQSYEDQSKSDPASVVASYEVGRQERSDDFVLDDYNEWGVDLSAYREN